MALVDKAHGTQTATIGTEHTLSTQATSGTYVLLVDVTNLAADEVLELRLKCKVLTGGTVRPAAYQQVIGPAVADDAVQASIPVPALFGATATLKQLNGTGRSFDWCLLTV